MKALKSVALHIFLASGAMLFYSCVSPTSHKIDTQYFEPFRSSKTVTIIIDQSYGKAKIGFKFRNLTRKFFEHAGLEVVEAKFENYDLAYVLKIKGNAIKCQYDLSGNLYTSASVSGSISLKKQGQPEYKKKFKGYVKCPYKIEMSIANRYKTPSGAPFRKAFRNSHLNLKFAEMIGEVFGAESLISALNDDDDNIRKLAMFGLTRIQDPIATPPLIATMENDGNSDDIRKLAAKSLGAMKDKRAVVPLIKQLADQNSPVRVSAALALGKINDPNAIEPLILTLGSAKDLHNASIESLKKITGQNLGDSKMQWLEWWSQNKTNKKSRPNS